MSNQFLLYLAAGLDALIPLGALLFLRSRHKFRITAVLGGFAAYFFTCEIIIPSFSVLFSAIGLGESFWTAHGALSETLNVLLNVVIGTFALYFVLRFTLKNRSRLYDAMAMGISYWLFNALRLAVSAVSYGRLSQMAQEGRLAEMATETLTVEQLQKIYDEFSAAGVGSFFVQLVGIIAMTIMTTTVLLFIYYSVKRSDLKPMLIAMAVNFVLLLAVNLSLYFGGNIPYMIACVIASLVSGYAFYRFMQWYHQQQIELAKRKKAYKEGLKSSSVASEEA